MKPHEDWVYESWTVDCVCGVNFDDGKEMVDCDECGIWVHTCCSRYVKGDDLFVCHKCKIKNNDKLKVTSKSLRMGNNSSSSQNQMLLPLKPCLEIPIEDRVHVNGVPGGDLGLFECVSTVFSSQLWKCCGYVPKKFRFQYSEFPCWDEKENVGVEDDDSFGGVFFSMSKGNNVDDKRTKEKSLVCDLSRNKGRKESRGDFEDQVKKKIKVVDKEEEDDIRRL